jgi:hypothetical protein
MLKTAHRDRSILERTVTVAVGEFSDPDAGKKTRHERQATATNPNAFAYTPFQNVYAECCISA